MKTSLDILTKARSKTAELSERQLSMRLGHSPTTIAMARAKGSLSPVLAGELAEIAGEDPTPWVALAALETAPDAKSKQRLLKAAAAMAKYWLRHRPTKVSGATCPVVGCR